jgi:hydrogenase maturation protein HypF
MLDQPAPEPILALGGELKSTVCLLAGSDAVMSEHLGELSNPVTYRNFVQTIDCLRTLLDVSPEVVACDMHPGYASVRYARQSGLRTVEVQHHHAHVAAIMAEAGWRSGVLGVSCDGTGFGTDGMVWGCELLACNGADFERVGHLRYFPLSGGDLAATQTWRPAAGLAFETYGTNWPRAVEAAFAGVDPRALAITRERFVGSNGGMMTSSLGRLFDAAAFFLGLSYENWHEAQAAMALEQAACATDTAKPLEYRLEKQDDGHGAAKMLLDIQPAMASLIERRASGDSVNQLAACFHETLVAMLSDAVLQLCDEMGMQRVALTGGCFANRLLLSGMMQRITAAGLDVRCHQKVPTGDGGIALGQAWLAAEKLRGA